MNQRESITSRYKYIFLSAGRYYISLALALAQIIAMPFGIILAGLILVYNTKLTGSELLVIALFSIAMLLVRDVLLGIGTLFVNKDALVRLENKKQGELLIAGTDEEKRAWRQITTFSWRYMVVSFISIILLTLTPLLIYMNGVLSVDLDQLIYTLIAGVVSGLGVALLEVILLERFLIRARETLMPSEFDVQISGVPGFRLLGKFILIFSALILVSILLVAPIGYHQTTRVLYEEIGSIKVLKDLQLQSFVIALIALAIGISLSFFLANSIAQPMRNMIGVFKKIEGGDLSQRIGITATDEVGELAVYFNRMAEHLEELQKNLENRVSERTEQLRATIEVGQVASGILEPGELITKVVNLITERFGHYYSAIFLIDQTGKWAELKDATGTAGQTLKAQEHRLEIGGNSMVSAAITKHEARIALDVGKESVRFNNPLLPLTRSEIALPLIVSNRVIGVLDVQSVQESAFNEDDISTLQGMANQVAIALENARLFNELQKNLTELRATHRTYLSTAWSDESLENLKYALSIPTNNDVNIPEGKSIEVPLTLRDQSIGQIQLERNSEWTSEERNFIEAIAAQASLALENARLLQDAQLLAAKEQQINIISSQIQKSTDLNLILQNTVRELGKTLHVPKAFIQVGLIPPKETDQG